MPQSPANETTQTATLRPPFRKLPPRRQSIAKQIITARLRSRRSACGERMLTVTTLSDGRERLPMIRLRGRWLARLGFTRDARIAVSEEQGRLVLTIVREE